MKELQLTPASETSYKSFLMKNKRKIFILGSVALSTQAVLHSLTANKEWDVLANTVCEGRDAFGNSHLCLKDVESDKWMRIYTIKTLH